MGRVQGMRKFEYQVRPSWPRVAVLVVAAAFVLGCGATPQTRLETVQIALGAAAGGGLSAEPKGHHLSWPVNATVKLVNSDSIEHSIYFTDLDQELRVGPASGDSPGVAFYSLGLLTRGTHHWVCRLGCPSPAPDGYFHVA